MPWGRRRVSLLGACGELRQEVMQPPILISDPVGGEARLGNRSFACKRTADGYMRPRQIALRWFAAVTSGLSARRTWLNDAIVECTRLAFVTLTDPNS